MRLLKTALAGLAISAVVCAPLMAAKADVCSYPHEQTALNSRVLQSELMVAALACGDKARYNQFVTRFQDELVPLGHNLIDFFKRNYGTKAQATLDSFVTSLANQSAMHSATSGQAFCEAMSDELSAALALTPADYGQLVASRKLAAGHGIQPCDQFAQDGATR
jgi:hypothetical protein